MPLAIAAVVVVVLVLVGLLARAMAQRERSAGGLASDGGASTPDTGSSRPTFRVVALGVAGSGKTVFLASMFHRLHVQPPDGAYFLETAAVQRVALSAVYRQVANPNQPWPAGTHIGETREFVFDCSSQYEGVKHRLFKINYLDYAGELLESVQEEGSTALADLERHIGGAQALLGMLDGHRILQYLRDEPAGRLYVDSSIQPMIGIMAGATCPIHFVLTKWDIVRGFGEGDDADDNARLNLVRNALLAGTQIADLVGGSGRPRRIVRLIPVSAVGRGFVKIDPGGTVVKQPMGAVRPTNVEIPLAAVLPDLFSQVVETLDASVRDEITARVRSQARLDSSDSIAMAARLLSIPASIVLRTTLQAAVGTTYGDEVVGMFLSWMGRPFEAKQAAIAATRREAEQQGALAQRVTARVLDEFAGSLWQVEKALPASVLSGK